MGELLFLTELERLIDVASAGLGALAVVLAAGVAGCSDGIDLSDCNDCGLAVDKGLAGRVEDAC